MQRVNQISAGLESYQVLFCNDHRFLAVRRQTLNNLFVGNSIVRPESHYLFEDGIMVSQSINLIKENTVFLQNAMQTFKKNRFTGSARYRGWNIHQSSQIRKNININPSIFFLVIKYGISLRALVNVLNIFAKKKLWSKGIFSNLVYGCWTSSGPSMICAIRGWKLILKIRSLGLQWMTKGDIDKSVPGWEYLYIACYPTCTRKSCCLWQ